MAGHSKEYKSPEAAESAAKKHNKTWLAVLAGIGALGAAGVVYYGLPELFGTRSETVAIRSTDRVDSVDAGPITPVPMEPTAPPNGRAQGFAETGPDGTMNAAPGQSMPMDATAPPERIVNLLPLFENGASSYVGRRVEILGAPVQLVSGQRVFWIGPSFNQKMPAVANTGVNFSGIEQADRVNLVGTIRQAPSADVMQQQWGIQEENLKALTETDIYLDVTSMERATGL